MSKALEKDFTELIEEVAGYNKDANLKLLREAWSFAKLAHSGQKRLSGDDFITHPLAVARQLAHWRVDTTSIVAGLLHDTIEDGGATYKDIIDGFGVGVAVLVDGVSKVTQLRLKGSKQKEFVENLRKMLLVMAKDLRVVLVKLADRLHNMQTLYALPPDSQKENARETLEIYAPLAERLGIGEAKGELEDLAFPYVYPEEYEKLMAASVKHYKAAEQHIRQMTHKLLAELAKVELKAVIHGRKKHYYSLWKKLKRPEIDGDFEKIHDIVALRILVNRVGDCYVALGVVHNLYKPVPHIGVSDFIAQPKPNGYRSIHTKVFGPGGRIVEVQIRTFEMHDQAEHGVAAHWSYSEVKSQAENSAVLREGVITPQDKLAWVKELVNWQRQIADSQEFLEAVKFDALSHRNFVFSPKGDVYDLPVGATTVDFAFAVHTGLGKYIAGARVNGKMVPLDFKLKSGDVVEIIKSKNPRPLNQDWLDFVVTTKARSSISKMLKLK